MRVRLVDNHGNVFVRNILPISIAANLDKTLIDLYSIANGIFLSEDLMRKDRNVSGIEFECYGTYSGNLSVQISELIEFMFGQWVTVSFAPNRQTFLLDVTAKKFANGYSCLFSAGLDSYVGVLDAKRKFGIVRAVFTKHKDQGAIYTLAQRLMGSMGRIDFKTVEAPEHKSRTRLARGVLYILYAFLLKERNVIVSEVGPTMYQPRFTLLDDVAITTHPYILRFSKIIAEAVLETKLTIVKPNENLTKAELASIGSDMEWLGDTCSCRRTRFAASAIPNCGVCFACVVRRLALMVAGVPKNVYWSDWSHERKRIDNIVHLIRFSIDYLTSPESIQRFTVDDIERYRKEDVFRRFALDNLAGLHLMMKHGEHLAQALQKLLDLGMETVSVESIENRIEEVRARTRSPDYGNIL